MALQVSVTIQNALLDAIETAIGTSPVFRVLTGSPPATCATAQSGTLLAAITCPSDWMAAASSNSKAKSGTWQDASADATGTPGYFRILDSSATTCHLQGTSAVGSGDLSFDTTISALGAVTISTFTLAAANS
jgi:hypothetical protein